jgi:SAM-dependent methyltransferase
MSLMTDVSLASTVPNVTWTHRALPSILDAIPVHCKSLLDVGCGRGIIGAMCRIYRGVDHLVGIDGFEPYLDFSRKAGFYDHVVLRDLNEVPLPFANKEFEVVTCAEVIEHLSEDAGRHLLDELERIAARVIVTTPNIRFEQDEYDGNCFQRHLSHWRPVAFRKRGYRVYGTGSLNVGYRLRGIVEEATKRKTGNSLPASVRVCARYISEALGPLTRRLPEFSTSLLCVRESTSIHP